MWERPSVSSVVCSMSLTKCTSAASMTFARMPGTTSLVLVIFVRSSSRTLERLGPDAFFLEVALAMAYYGAACILSTMMCLAYIELRYRVFGDYECIHWTTTAARNG